MHSKMKDIWKNSAQLLSANVVAQAIGLLVYPILTRLYSPDDFGLFNLFLSIGGILVLCSTAEYQNAIVLPKESNKAVALFHVGASILLGVTMVILLSVPFSGWIGKLFNTSALAKWYWLMPVYVFVMGFWTLLNYFYTRAKEFRRISGYQLSQSVLSAGSKIGLGYGGLLSGGLIVGSVIAPLISAVISVRIAGKKVLGGLLHWDRDECKSVAHEYANFPKFSLPRSLVNSLGGNLPILLLTPFFSLSQIGYFGMALTLGFRPLNMISASLYQTFFQQTAERVNNRVSIVAFFKQFITKTLLIAVPVFVGMWFILPLLTEWLLGTGWGATGELIRVILPWLLMSLIVAPICFLSDIFGKQKKALVFEIAFLLSRLVGLGTGLMMNNFYWAIVGYSIGGALVIACQLIWLMSLVKNYEREIAFL